MTCTMRRLSAWTRGSPVGTSMSEVIPSSSAEEGVSCPVHKDCHVGRLGADGQRAGLDAHHVQEVIDQFSHVVRLVNYDLEELSELSRIQL